MNSSRLFRRVRSRLTALWNDQSGETSVLSLVLICTIIAIGATVGLTAYRDQVVQELGDLSVAIESLNQSFTAGPYGTFTDTPFRRMTELDSCLNLAGRQQVTRRTPDSPSVRAALRASFRFLNLA